MFGPEIRNYLQAFLLSVGPCPHPMFVIEVSDSEFGFGLT
jgi:hypothetical protein